MLFRSAFFTILIRTMIAYAMISSSMVSNVNADQGASSNVAASVQGYGDSVNVVVDGAKGAAEGVKNAAGDVITSNASSETVQDATVTEDDDLGSKVLSIINTLSNLTCETQVAMKLLRGKFSHTCMQSTYASLAVANIVSPLLYAMTMVKLRLRDPTGELFGGQDCNYKTPYKDQKLSFAFCSNWKMIAVQAMAAVIGAYVIFDALLSGEDVWVHLSTLFTHDPSIYSQVYMDQPVGRMGVFIDLTGGFPWKVMRDRDTICLATQSFGGWIPVGCRFIAEPFPSSRYQPFFTGEASNAATIDTTSTELLNCSHLGPCYKRARDKSKAVVSISSPIVECVRDSLVKLLVSKSVCSFKQARAVNSMGVKTESIIFEFQRKMHLTVTALLTMYIIFFGFKVIMGQGVPAKGELVTFVVKFILVTYFSVGLNSSGEFGERYDGMTEWIFPLVFDAPAQLASMVLGTGGINGLCEFHAGDYEKGFGHLALWDAVDCRLGHYLGIDTVIDIAERAKNGGSFGFSIPPYFILLIPAALMGNIMLIIIIIMYPILVIAVTAYLVNSFVVGLLITTILGVMAPLFVPCALFERTKGYFNNWARIMMSFILQPMIVTTFLLTMFSVYDMGFFGTCEYTPKTTTIDNIERTYYQLDTDESHYEYEQLKECKNTLGWILNAITNFNVGAVVEVVKGLFTNSLSSSFEKILSFIYSMLTACLILVLIYYMTGSLIDFAADLSMGMSLSGVAVGADQMANAMKGRAEQAMNNMKGKDDKDDKDDKDGESDDKMSDKDSSNRSDANSGDSMSGKGEGGGDSSGGGKGLSGSKSGGDSSSSSSKGGGGGSSSGGGASGGGMSGGGGGWCWMRITPVILKIIRLSIIICITIIMQSSASDDQYQTCIAIPSIVADTEDSVAKVYMDSYTLYGRIKDMVVIGDSGTFSDRCQPASSAISFEMRSDVLSTQANNNNAIRQQYTLYENNSIDVNTDLLKVDNISTVSTRVRLTAKRFGSSKLCLTMPTIYGAAPLTCKLVPSLSAQEGAGLIDEDDIVPECTFYAPSCMEDRFNSQTLLNFSGRAVQCLRDTLDAVFFSTPFCPSTSKIRQTPINPFPEFQKTMHLAVIALITMYIIFFGMMMLLEPFRFDPKQAIMGVLKIVFVIYFAIGIGTTQYKDGKPYTANGVVEWGLPIFTQAASGFATFVFSSVNGNGLCSFDPRSYTRGKEYYALWDSLDCRVGIYFGVLPNYNIGRSLKDLPVSRTNPPKSVKELRVKRAAAGRGGWLSNSWRDAGNAIAGAASDVAGAASSAAHGVAGAAQGAASAVAGAATAIANDPSGALSSAAHDVAGAAKDAAQGVAGVAKDTAHGVAGAATAIANDPSGALSSTAHDVAGAAKGAAGAVAGAASSAANDVAGAASNLISTSGSSAYAQNVSSSSEEVRLDEQGDVVMIGLDSDFSLRLFTAMWGYLMVGSLLVVVSCLSFIIVFLTLLFKLLTTFLLSMITLYVLAYFSPIFVPMALFDRTKGYFQGWLKMCLSCAVRPAVIAGFIALLVIVYDGVFFRDCQFVKYTYSDGTAQFHTFNLAFLQDPGAAENACDESMGYRLLKKYLGYDWDYISLLILKIYYVTDGWVALESVAYLLLWTMVFFFFGQTMEGLASDISGGPSMESMTGGMYTLLKTLRQALSAASFVGSKVGSGVKAVGGVAMKGGSMAGKAAGRGISAGASAAADTKVGRAVIGGAQATGGAIKGVAGSVGGGISKGAKAVGNTKVGRKAVGGAKAASRGASKLNAFIESSATAIEKGTNTAQRLSGSKVAKMKDKPKAPKGESKASKMDSKK